MRSVATAREGKGGGVLPLMGLRCAVYSYANYSVAVGGFKVDPNNPAELRYEAEVYFCGDSMEALLDYLSGVHKASMVRVSRCCVPPAPSTT